MTPPDPTGGPEGPRGPMDRGHNPFDFEDTPEDRVHPFTMRVDAGETFEALFPLTRHDAEELMFQMVFVLGYKLAN